MNRHEFQQSVTRINAIIYIKKAVGRSAYFLRTVQDWMKKLHVQARRSLGKVDVMHTMWRRNISNVLLQWKIFYSNKDTGLEIATVTWYRILIEHFNIRKLFGRWVPHLECDAAFQNSYLDNVLDIYDKRWWWMKVGWFCTDATPQTRPGLILVSNRRRTATSSSSSKNYT